MPTIEQNDQAEYRTRDEKSSPTNPASNRSKTEPNQVKQSKKAAVNKKAAVKRKTARKKAAKTAGDLTDSAKKKTSQTSRKTVQTEESTGGKMDTKQVEQPKKVAVRKKTTRKKAAKTAVGRVGSANRKEPQTRRKEIQNEESTSSKLDTKQVEQPKKVAVKRKTTRKKAAKTAGVGVDSANKKVSQTRRKESPPERASGTDQGAPVTASEAGKAQAAVQSQPEKPAADPVRPAAAPPPSQPQNRGGTGLMGFWIKVGAAAFVIVAGVIGIYAFFSEDEASSGPQATQAAASAQGGDASVADSVATDTGTGRGVVFPLATEQSKMTNLEPLGGYNNAPGAPPAAGANAANEPVAAPAVRGGVTPGGTPAADQALANQRIAAPPTPQSGRFYNEPAEYRPELYRPLTPQQDPAPASQAATANETPSAYTAPAPAYYPPPGGYAYPPAPGYGGYGGYYPY